MGELIQTNLPTLYEYYTSNGISSGLTTETSTFKLNGKDIFLYSGAMHYFRVPKKYWRDRLRKMRAAGLNAVETYVPWNLHEYESGSFDFGNGGSDFEDFLDIKEFLKIAQEEDLLALVRPGPYICSEWEFGGLPSWLLRENNIKVRTSDDKFMKYVERYFNMLLPILAALQFTKGGPIVALQIENEYGSVEVNNKVDHVYLNALKDLMTRNGIVELLFTSDGIGIHGNVSQIPGVLMTANFQTNPTGEFKKLQQYQPNKPVMSMEYWTGWFDHWSEQHHVRDNDNFEQVLKQIIQYPASVNQYMFHGGTNWGFMNGANIADGGTDNKGYQPDTTSYDYDAALSENGDYTDKYIRTKKLLSELNPIRTKIPQAPTELPRGSLPTLQITQQLTIDEALTQITPIQSPKLLPMEQLPINNNSGQSYGYIVYKKTNLDIPPNSTLKIAGRVCDTVMVLINGVLISKPLENNSDLDKFGYWRLKDSTLNLGNEDWKGATLELVVENWGRNNFGSLRQFNQFKGLWQGPVSINNEVLSDWEIFPLEFKKVWTNSLLGWHEPKKVNTPALYKAIFKIDEPMDTFVDMRQWTKGITIINGFVLGRHAIIGPQMTLYLPAPFLKKGDNEIIIFEHFNPARDIKFVDKPIFKSTKILKPHNV